MKKLAILGGGESGTGAAILASVKGYDVYLSDKGFVDDKHKELLLANRVEFEEGGHTESKILKTDEVIKSPGIPNSAPIIQKLIKSEIPIIDELEFASRYTTAKKICITGSNGKTTTTLLLHHILKNSGLNVGVAGNIGKSFAKQVAERDFDVYVIEISSFQLDGMKDFKADIAILLNITPDHLDRYGYDFNKYAESKFQITRNQTAEDSFIYFEDDPAIAERVSGRFIQAAKYPFTLNNAPKNNGAWIEENKIKSNINKNHYNMFLEKLALQGKHNLCNSMASGIAAQLMAVRNESLRESLSNFQNIEHRLEFVARIQGIDFINDSKATNVNSVWYALECQNKPVVWIAGGVDKGNDYEEIMMLVRKKVKGLVCLGTDNTTLLKAFTGVIPLIDTATSMTEAVKKAYRMAETGEVVLLSPACASFDLFTNYEHRGWQFKSVVKEL